MDSSLVGVMRCALVEKIGERKVGQTSRRGSLEQLLFAG